MATHTNVLAWRILWMEESGGLQSVGLQRIRHDWAGMHWVSLCNILSIFGTIIETFFSWYMLCFQCEVSTRFHVGKDLNKGQRVRSYQRCPICFWPEQIGDMHEVVRMTFEVSHYHLRCWTTLISFTEKF